MTESATSLPSQPKEAEEVCNPSVPPDGMAVTVVVQLPTWNEQVKNPTSMLSSWYQAVLQMVSNYLSTTLDEPSLICHVHVLNPRTKYDTSADRYALEDIRRVLKEASRDTSLWHIEPEAPSASVSLLRYAISRQEEPIFYVFVTDGLFWSQNPFWTEVIQEDRVEKGIVLDCDTVNKVVKVLTSVDKTLPATNQAESHHTPGSAASASLHEPYSMSAQGVSTPGHETVDQLHEQLETVAKKSSCIGKKLKPSGRQGQFVTPGETDDSESKEDIPTEFSPSPSVAPVEKATPAQKGDEFLSFLERALSIYEKV